MKILSWIINILIVLVGAGIYLWAGIIWSKWSNGRLEFDQGWLLIALLLSQLFTSRVSGGKLDRQKWLRTIPTALAGFALEGLSDHLFLQLTKQPSRSHVIAFAVSTCLFLIYIVVWIVAFPYEEFFGPDTTKERHPWKRLVRLAGVLIAVVIVSGTVWSFYVTGYVTGAPISGTADALQAWFYKAALLVYLFLALKMFYPLFEKRLSQSPRWS